MRIVHMPIESIRFHHFCTSLPSILFFVLLIAFNVPPTTSIDTSNQRLLPRFSDLFAAQPCRSVAPWQLPMRFLPHVVPAIGFRSNMTAVAAQQQPAMDRITLAEDSLTSGFCRSSEQCKAVGGLPLPTSCALGLGICCVDLAQCGRTSRQRDVRQGSRSFPDVQPRPGFCSLRVERSAPAIRLFKVTLEHIQLASVEPQSSLGCVQDAIWLESPQSPLDRLRFCGTAERQTFLIRLPVGQVPPALNVRVATSGIWTQRRWLIRVQQLEQSHEAVAFLDIALVGSAQIKTVSSASNCDQLIDLSGTTFETFRPMVSLPPPTDHLMPVGASRVYKTCASVPANTCQLILLPAATDHSVVVHDVFAHWNLPSDQLLALAVQNEHNAIASSTASSSSVCSSNQSHFSIRQLSNRTTHAQPINYCGNQLHLPILLRSPFELLVVLHPASPIDILYRPLPLSC